MKLKRVTGLVRRVGRVGQKIKGKEQEGDVRRKTPGG
nr:MAG TPA: hypothetical protein [Caudoviricetes sp.]